ncbi:hypothetical protein [Microbacterium sp. P5_E9]
MPRVRVAGTVVAVTLIALALAACSSSVGGYADESAQSDVSCEEVAASVVQRERGDDTSGAINDEMQYLADNCPDAYDITVDYVSSRSTDPQFRFETCEEAAQYIRAEAVELLRADGLCSDGAAAGGVSESPTGEGLPWNEAVNHAGSNERVCGPLASQGRDDDDVFLNLGRAYPDPARFQIVLWDVGGVESLPVGTTVCATGPITLYNGVAQIELEDVGAVQVGN